MTIFYIPNATQYLNLTTILRNINKQQHFIITAQYESLGKH